MSTSDDLVTAVKDDFASVEWHTRVQTMLLCIGLIGVGFLLGVGYYSTIIQIELPASFAPQYPSAVEGLNSQLQRALLVGVGVAATGLAGAVYIESTHAEPEEGENR